jgi:peptide/nickel transport system permease protein
VFKHALRASLTPVVSLFAVRLRHAVGRPIITETVFNLPGLGTYVVRSVHSGDQPSSSTWWCSPASRWRS